METKVYAKYRLLKDMPGLKAGAIFEHREWSKDAPDVGNIGCGAMVLAWINGFCQQDWAGGSFALPGQLAKDREWFKELCSCGCSCCGG